MGDGDSAACAERRASCLVDLEIPLLASFPYLLGGAERVPHGQWFGRRVIVGALHGVSPVRVVTGPVATCGYDRFPVELSAIIAAMRAAGPRRGRGLGRVRVARSSLTTSRDPIRGHRQVGSLTGAVHLSKNNAGVLRPAQRGRKPRVEQKGKSWLDPRRSVRVGTAKASASRSSRPLKSFQREVSEKLPQG